MFRRALPVGRCVGAALPAISMAVRAAHHKPTTHDWSQMWSHPLTAEEAEVVAEQSHRTVSGVVPGEMFMRHWIVAEQSTVSVVNRVISGMIAVFTMIWAAGYATLGYNGHNAAHVAGWAFIGYWLVLHTHRMWLAPTFLALAFAELILN